jgi:hypothetical protein
MGSSPTPAPLRVMPEAPKEKRISFIEIEKMTVGHHPTDPKKMRNRSTLKNYAIRLGLPFDPVTQTVDETTCKKLLDESKTAIWQNRRAAVPKLNQEIRLIPPAEILNIAAAIRKPVHKVVEALLARCAATWRDTQGGLFPA